MYSLPNQNESTIAVIGLGYVGLPVAIEFAKQKTSFRDNKKLNHKIIGFDINKNRINDLKKGLDKTCEINEKEILNLKNIFFTTDTCYLSDADVFIVTVPTPVDKSKRSHSHRKACKTIGIAIKNNTKSYSHNYLREYSTRSIRRNIYAYSFFFSELQFITITIIINL